MTYSADDVKMILYMILKKIVIDTCVIISSLKSQSGASYKILSALNKNKFRYGISTALYCEYEAKIKELSGNGTLALNKKDIDVILAGIVFYSCAVPIYYRIRPNLKDENHNMVYECAVNFGADYIVTFNEKDFRGGDLKPYSPEIVSPQFLLKKVGI